MLDSIRRICLWGGPGVGKSTIAASLFADMKAEGMSVELINEHVKIDAYKGQVPDKWSQVSIFAKQLEEEQSYLNYGVKYVVTPAPLGLCCYYSHKAMCEAAEWLLKIEQEFEKQFPSLNCIVTRKHKYVQSGRFHSINQALEIDTDLLWNYRQLSWVDESKLYKTIFGD